MAQEMHQHRLALLVCAHRVLGSLLLLSLRMLVVLGAAHITINVVVSICDSPHEQSLVGPGPGAMSLWGFGIVALATRTCDPPHEQLLVELRWALSGEWGFTGSIHHSPCKQLLTAVVGARFMWKWRRRRETAYLVAACYQAPSVLFLLFLPSLWLCLSSAPPSTLQVVAHKVVGHYHSIWKV